MSYFEYLNIYNRLKQKICIIYSVGYYIDVNSEVEISKRLIEIEKNHPDWKYEDYINWINSLELKK